MKPYDKQQVNKYRINLSLNEDTSALELLPKRRPFNTRMVLRGLYFIK